MKKVLLINPSSKEFLTNAGDRMPLGLLYIAAYLEKRNKEVRVVDLDHSSMTELGKIVSEFKPDVAGVSVYTSVLYPQARQLGELLSGKCKTVAGGYHATALPGSLLDLYDAVVVGEGEIALNDIVDNDLTGLVIRGKTPVDNIEHPARHLLDSKNYMFKLDEKKAATLMTSRGCPNACDYCGNMNRQMRFFSNEFVIEELKQLQAQGYNDFYFLDDAFSINKKRTLELMVKAKTLGINYRATMRAKSVTSQIARGLKDSGCTWVSLGIESGVNERLKDIHKNMTVEDNIIAIKYLKENKIKVKGFFMFGLPNETESDANTTIKYSQNLKRLGLTSADFYIMTPFPGTDIWNNPDSYGITIEDKDYTKYLEIGKRGAKAFHRTTHLSRLQIEGLRNKAEREFNG